MKKFPHKRGFSLIEVMIALFVFALLAMGLTALTLNLRKLSETMIYREQALMTAQNYAEQIRTLAYNSLSQAVGDEIIELKQTTINYTANDGIATTETVNVPVSETEWLVLELPIKTNSADSSGKNEVMDFRIRTTVSDGLTSAELLEIHEVDIFYGYKTPTNTDDWVSEEFRILVVSE